MLSIGERLAELEKQNVQLQKTIESLNSIVSQLHPSVTTMSGLATEPKDIRGIDIKSRSSAISGAGLIWSDTEKDNPPINAEPGIPTVGYNKHTHSQFSGGALLFDEMEIVEYDFTKKSNGANVPVGQRITNKHSQGFWTYTPKIQIVKNSKGEEVNKIGELALTFAPDIQKWGTSAFEIDVTQCYFVKRRLTANKDVDGNVIAGEDVGDIEKDSKGNEMKSPLMVLTTEESTDPITGDKIKNAVIDNTKTSIIWDENGKCWRTYAVYASGTAGV